MKYRRNKKIAQSAKKLAKKNFVFVMDVYGTVTKHYEPHLKANLYVSKNKIGNTTIIPEQWILNLRNS